MRRASDETAASSAAVRMDNFVRGPAIANPPLHSDVNRSDPVTPLALVCSVRLECTALLEAMKDARHHPVGRKSAWTGTLQGTPVRLLEAGMGKTNAAQALTALLEQGPPSAVLSFGVGGAYPGSGLRLEQIALGSASIYGDEGVDAPGGWMGTDGIGIPLVERGGERWFNQFHADPALLSRAEAALRDAGIEFEAGPILTVSACSGTTARGRQLWDRWGALCEGMEGAALAHVCALYGVPFLELRAVSNPVEDRDLSGWRLKEAAAAAQRAVELVAAAAVS
jgi:futalosine hydrolase